MSMAAPKEPYVWILVRKPNETREDRQQGLAGLPMEHWYLDGKPNTRENVTKALRDAGFVPWKEGG